MRQILALAFLFALCHFPFPLRTEASLGRALRWAPKSCSTNGPPVDWILLSLPESAPKSSMSSLPRHRARANCQRLTPDSDALRLQRAAIRTEVFNAQVPTLRSIKVRPFATGKKVWVRVCPLQAA